MEEVNLGFIEVESFTEKLYLEVYGKYQNFKPTKNDTIADLLLFIGGFSIIAGKTKNYFKAFKVFDDKQSNKYANFDSIPIIFQLTKWAHKNKKVNYSNEILNGLIRCLLGLVDEKDKEIVYKFLNKSYNFINSD